MLGGQLAHWSFSFHSEASFMEGNRIRDDGPTHLRVHHRRDGEGYAPLDQYLMGFRAPMSTPTFLVRFAHVSSEPSPQVGGAFDGNRRNIAIQDLIDAVGRRTPDSTVSQRRFHSHFC